MPTDEDIAFGRAAVQSGDITQDDLDDAIQLLHDLKRGGSNRRLWEVLARRGLLANGRIAEIRAQLAEDTSATSPTPVEVMETQAVVPPPLEPVFADAAVPGIVLIRLRSGRAPEQLAIYARPMTIGKDAGVDIVLDEPGVDDRHARLTWNDRGATLWDVGTESGVYVNGSRVTNRLLQSGDAIVIGEALLLYVQRQGETEPTEPTTPWIAGVEARACLRVIEGLRANEVFYLADRALLIGSNELCDIPLIDGDVGEFHAQVMCKGKGGRILDLRSAAGTMVNDARAPEAELDDGSHIRLGSAVFCFELLQEAVERDIPMEQVASGVKPVEDRSSDSFEVPLEVHLADEDAEQEAFGEQRTHTVGLAAANVNYAAGDLRFTCLEGAAEGRTFALDRSTMVLGREKKADVSIPDLAVSRRHATIIMHEGRVTISDLNSRNGLIVNGRKVEQAQLKVGDTIRIGTCLLLVDWSRRSA